MSSLFHSCQPAPHRGRRTRPGLPPRQPPAPSRVALAALLLGLLGSPRALRAQEEAVALPGQIDQALAEAPAKALPETVVRARAPSRARRRAPTAQIYEVTLRDRVEIDPDLGAALATLPPVELHRYGGGLTTFSLRGAASHQTRVEIGGFPLTPLGGGSIDLSDLDPELFSRAEIVSGPQGAAFGAGALGGVLALEPAPTLARRAGAGAGPFSPRAELSLELGSFQRAGLALRTTPAPGLGLALYADRNEGDFAFERDLTPNLAGDPWLRERRKNNAGTLGGLLLSGRRTLGSAEARTLLLLTQKQQALAGPVGFPTPGARADTTRALVGLAIEGRATGRVRTRARAYLRAEGLHLLPGDRPVPGSAGEARTRLLESGAEAQARLTLGRHRVDLGAALEGSALRDAPRDAPASRSARAVGALFIGDRLLLARGRLLASLTARLELPTGLRPQPSVAAGLQAELAPELALRLNLGRSVRLPTLVELHRESALLAPNPELRPESAIAADLGLAFERQRGSARTELELVAFVSRYHDLITYELYPPLKLRASNLRAALIAGLEARARLSPLPELSVELSYALTHTRSLRDDVNERGQPLPYRPLHRGLLRVEGAWGPLSAHLDAEGRSTLGRNRSGTKSLPPRMLFHLGLRLTLGGGCSLALRLDNLFDARRQQDVNGYPLPGRTFLTNLRCAFNPKGTS